MRTHKATLTRRHVILIKLTVVWLLLGARIFAAAVDQRKAPRYPDPDVRYKADILLVIAHPDDETGDIGAYLARAVFDEHRRVAVVCATRGDHGGNSYGNARSAALGIERETEARAAFAYLGIKNVWFLGAGDTPSQDVLSSLEHWNHGAALGEVVRIVRLTRPEIVLTWLPNAVAGENHGDHQAASVIATEAFDLAGNPAVFSEQIFAPRHSLGTPAEGLEPWQPQKIYYYSDADDALGYWQDEPRMPSPFRKNFLDGAGPQYFPADISPSQHRSYASISAEETSFYLTQDGGIGKQALESNNFKDFEYPVRLIFGKSLVGGTVTGDVFEGVVQTAIPFVGQELTASPPQDLAALTLDGPWNFYREFWKAHHIENIGNLLPIAEIEIRAGSRLQVPLLIRNTAQADRELQLRSSLPESWLDRTRYDGYTLGSGATFPIEASIDVPPDAAGWFELTWKVDAMPGTLKLRVAVRKKAGEP